MTAINTELAAAMPWLTAEEWSIWEINGEYKSGLKFDHSLAFVVPEYAHGLIGQVVFQNLASGIAVTADRVTRARRLLLVDANNPRKAYWEDDQQQLSDGLARGDS